MCSGVFRGVSKEHDITDKHKKNISNPFIIDIDILGILLIGLFYIHWSNPPI